jgi:hypothetical protein
MENFDVKMFRNKKFDVKIAWNENFGVKMYKKSPQMKTLMQNFRKLSQMKIFIKLPQKIIADKILI